MIKKFGNFNEGKVDQDLIDKLLDKGVKNLTKGQKDLLNYLSKGGLINNYEKKNKFEIGDKIVYRRDGSINDGKTGIFTKIREDGKYVIRFDDGVKLAANPKYLRAERGNPNPEIDPYGEEDWYKEEPEEPERRPHIIMINPRQGIGRIPPRQPNNVPSDFYFHVGVFDGRVTVAMTSREYFDREGELDDSLGSHSLSPAVRRAMYNSGVHSEAEEMESIWSGRPGFTVEQIRENMIGNGFIHDQNFVNFLNQQHGQ